MSLMACACPCALLIASAALYGHRIAVEEKILLAHLGEPHQCCRLAE